MFRQNEHSCLEHTISCFLSSRKKFPLRAAANGKQTQTHRETEIKILLNYSFLCFIKEKNSNLYFFSLPFLASACEFV